MVDGYFPALPAGFIPISPGLMFIPSITAGYPDLSDLAAFLSDAQITGLSDATLQLALDAAIERWEEETHWVPFCSDTAGEITLAQDPPCGRFLDLEKPFRSISSVKTDVTAFSAGIERTRGLDYEFIYFRRESVTCIQAIDFGGAYFTGFASLPNSVVITGLPGVTDTLPRRVFRAILTEAARQALEMQKGGGGVIAAGLVKAIAQGPIRTEYTTGAEGVSSAIKTRAQNWGAEFDACVATWKRSLVA